MQEQTLFDFDNHQSTHVEDTSSANVIVTQAEPNQLKRYAPERDLKLSDKPTLLAYAEQEAARHWKAFKHRRDCLMHIGRFSQLDDFGYLPMDRITTRHLYHFQQALIKTGMKGGTANRHIASISGLMRHAVHMGDLEQMPLMPKYIKEAQPRLRVFTDEEIKQLIDFFHEEGVSWMADMVIVGVLTGMRKSEIVALGDVAEISACGSEVYLPASLTKTKKERYVPLNEKALQAALRLRDCIRQEFRHDIFYDRWWNAKARIAPNDDQFVFHVTRHTCASRLANNGLNSGILGEILGHASEKTTRRYIHGDMGAKKAAVSGLNINI